MDTEPLSQLDAPYNNLLEQGRLDEYIATLSNDGPGWWFNMDVPRLAVHLAPLQSIGEDLTLPPHIMLLAEATRSLNDYMSVENLDSLYLHLSGVGDHEAAALASAAIWDSGIDLERYALWHDRITTLLKMDTRYLTSGQGLPPRFQSPRRDDGYGRPFHGG
ncbi:MAG: hypothetical protein ACE5D4_05790 [Thermodesulfobacteriota bacterium]